MNDTVIKKILAGYGYTNFRLLPVEKGYRNESHPFQLSDGQTYNLILYKREPGILTLIKYADRTARAAGVAGLPARQPIGNQIVTLRAGDWLKHGRIYNYLPGATIPWEAYTQAHIKLLGKTLSDLHAALQPLPINGYPQVAEQYMAIVNHMQTYFETDGVRNACRQKLGLQITAPYAIMLQILQASRKLTHQQVLHMDFVRSNLLFSGEDPIVLSGILDFEKTAVGHPLFDIARTLAFLLVDCKYKREEQVRKYFLYSGYRRRGSSPYQTVTIKGNDKHEDLLEILVQLFLFYDFYKFLRHNPYESLSENEHFMRTKAILLAQGLVEVV